MALAKKPAAAAKAAPKKTSAKAAVAKPAPTKSAKAAPAKAAGATPATVTLKHLASQLADRHDTPKKQAETMVSELFELMITHLKGGDRLRINGFGILQVKDRPARTGRNPATGATIQIAASKKIGFRPAKELKEAI